MNDVFENFGSSTPNIVIENTAGNRRKGKQ